MVKNKKWWLRVYLLVDTEYEILQDLVFIHYKFVSFESEITEL